MPIKSFKKKFSGGIIKNVIITGTVRRPPIKANRFQPRPVNFTIRLAILFQRSWCRLVAINSRTVWCVDTEVIPNNTREKTDMQLYTRSVAGIDAGIDQPFVECASCHDPHSEVNPTFLRVSNNGSAVCLACHVK